MAKENPYKEVKEISAWKWMIKHHSKRMIFSFLFLSIFMVAPWVGRYAIEEMWLRLLISGISLALNFVSTIIYPYTIYRGLHKSHDRWQKNYESGMYD
ncbi:MAG: hypothetical protein SLAVMIC_00568 [uncultured marine phage]|uniref:Uncharacterized protein n=1 Tax=uncultured marine phage TaxID=707152 RepID=A0A8D9FR72_9VIRU|nr:MAG: hypothetical protein SLAVMIC_00568 [uncultured marine phage]